MKRSRRWMNCGLALLALVALLLVTPSGESFGAAAAAAAAATTTATTIDAPPQPREVTWQKTADEVEIGEMEMPGQAKAVTAAKIGFGPGGGTVRVLDLDKPGITQSSWSIEGKVRYANVIGDGYIEMWSHFPDGSAYFSRTLDTSGPMGVLHGKSEWREFKLPFFSEAAKVPSKIEVNVVLPSGGTVWLGPAKLKQVIAQPPAAATAIKKATRIGTVAAPWWNASEGGWIGGILGIVLGVFGALIGTLASTGRGRRLAIPLMVGGVIVCALLLIVGVIAWGSGQPYAVWYPLILSGAIGVCVMGSLLPVMKRRVEELEMRKMTALDA